MKKLGQTIQNHISEHSALYVFTLVLFTMGVSFGAIIVHSLSLSQKQDLMGYLGQFFLEIQQGYSIEPRISFQESVAHYLKYVGLMWMLGLSIIGLPIILIMLFMKGMVVGFTVGVLLQGWKWKGLFAALVAVLPQNIVVAPAILIVGTSAVAFSLRLIRSRFQRGYDPILPYFMKYSFLVMLMAVILCIASLFEAFVSPVLMKTVSF